MTYYAWLDPKYGLSYIADHSIPSTGIPSGAVEITDEQWQDSLNNPGKYTIQNGEFVLAPDPTPAQRLASAQQAKITELQASLNATLAGGFKSNTTGHTYVTTTNGQSNMEGDLKRFDLDNTLTSVQFYTVDAGWITHSHQDLINAFLDGGKWKDAQYAQFNTLEANAKDATTMDAVNAITWTPATY